MMSKRLFCSLVIFLLLIATSVNATPEEKKADDGWKWLKNENIILEYESRDSDIAQKIWPELVKQIDLVQTRLISVRSQIDQMQKTEDKALQFMVSMVGLKEPSDSMREAYEIHAITIPEGSFTMFPEVWKFRLWHREEIKDRLRNGEQIDWFSYDPATDTVNYTLNFSSKAKMPSDKYLPVLLSSGTSPEQIVKHLSAISAVPEWISGMSGSPCAVYNTVVGGAILNCNVTGSFRRWFDDGIGQVIAELCTKEIDGESAYKAILEEWGNSNNYEPLKQKVDLINWRAGECEHDLPTKMDGNLAFAHHYYATLEIRGLVERHGVAVIPKIIQEISKSKLGDSEAIFAAIKKVTGEDMLARLNSYGSANDDPFKGTATSNMTVGYAELKPDGSVGDITKASTIPLITDGKHVIVLEFEFAVLNPPVTVAVGLNGATEAGRSGVISSIAIEAKNGRYNRHWDLADLKPGDYTIRISFNDKLYKEIPLKLVEATTK